MEGVRLRDWDPTPLHYQTLSHSPLLRFSSSGHSLDSDPCRRIYLGGERTAVHKAAGIMPREMNIPLGSMLCENFNDASPFLRMTQRAVLLLILVSTLTRDL